MWVLYLLTRKKKSSKLAKWYRKNIIVNIGDDDEENLHMHI